MAISITPFIPRNIIVHLGLPSAYATNVTVPFPDYVKNVVCSEIYPTWEPAALRANVIAIVTYALNRVYTEFYPSQGYDFNITSTTAFDQKYTPGIMIFDNISQLVDEIFTSYLRRIGTVEPLASKFCNGTTSTCGGMSQWGSQDLAKKGYDSMGILRYYYGNDIELVTNNPVDDIIPSYSGTPLRLGSVGKNVTIIQASLNRISQNYPAIPKITPVNGVFNAQTEASVKSFQRIFNLTADGVVGSATWYRMVYLYVGVNQLSELVSLGQNFTQVSFQYSGVLREGDRNDNVRVLQYMLSLLAEFNRALRVVEIDGIFGPATTNAVLTYQSFVGLVADGVVGYGTWSQIYTDFYQLEDSLQRDEVRFPNETQGIYQQSVGGQYPGFPLSLGISDGGQGL